MEAGNLSSVKWIDGNLGEYRIDAGPGYRVYLARSGKDQLILLNGGDKGSQAKDILVAKTYVATLRAKG